MTNLNVPSPLSQTMETKLVCDFSGIHRVRQVLLVGEHQEKGITEFILIEHPLKLLASLSHTFPVIGVNDKDDTLCVLEIWAG